MTLQMKTTCFLLALIASSCRQADCAGYGNELSCATSQGQSGNCIALPRCQYVMNIIQKNGIRSEQVQQFLRLNRCGFEGRDPKVCCPRGNDSVDDRNDVGQQTHPPPIWNSQTTAAPKWNNNWNQQTTAAPSWSNNWKQQKTTSKPKYVNPLMLLPRDCGLDSSDRIIGGEKTALGEFPWMAVLEYRQDSQVQTSLACGGTLISKRYVLTAAHCIRAAPSYMHLTNVRLGEHDVRYNPDCIYDNFGRRACADSMLSVPIERQIVHESYGTPQPFRNDIALLRLARDVTFTKYIKPICLPTSGMVSQNYWSAGWGAIETRRSSDIKLKVNLPYVNPVPCALKYSEKRVVLGQGQICAGGNAGKDTCKGDSGGPLMKQMPASSGPNRWVLDGVLSLGHSPCGLQGWPGVYTKVYDYIPWVIGKLEP